MIERFLPCARCAAKGRLPHYSAPDGGTLSDAPGAPWLLSWKPCPECGPALDARCAPGVRVEHRAEAVLVPADRVLV